MSSNNKVLSLKKKIKKCQEETKKLLQEKEKEGWSEKSKIMEQKKETTEALLRRQKQCNSIQTSAFEKELKELEKRNKYVAECEAKLKVILERSRVNLTEYKKFKDSQLREIERRKDKIVKIMSDKSRVNELRRKELERRLECLGNFCAAIYSTLKSKESKKHI